MTTSPAEEAVSSLICPSIQLQVGIYWTPTRAGPCAGVGTPQLNSLCPCRAASLLEDTDTEARVGSGDPNPDPGDEHSGPGAVMEPSAELWSWPCYNRLGRRTHRESRHHPALCRPTLAAPSWAPVMMSASLRSGLPKGPVSSYPFPGLQALPRENCKEETD